MEQAPTLLDVRRLTIGFGDDPPVVDQLSFSVAPGETLALVGESGSGKSITALATLGLLPPSAEIRDGSVNWQPATGHPVSLNRLTEKAFRSIRSREIGMIFQEPLTALNPTQRIDRQLAEVPQPTGSAWEKIQLVEWLEKVQLPEADRILRAYPHELSGGQRQRVLIAMAMMASPRLLIADEPTTALDSVTEAGILALLRTLTRQENTALLIITHDLAVVRYISDRILVLKNGRTVEESRSETLLNAPEKAYTKRLIDLSPRLRFATPSPKDSVSHAGPEAVLSVRNLSLSYPLRRNWRGKPTVYLRAVDQVDLDLHRGDFVALIGASGCGKSSLARCICGLARQWAGTISPGDQRIQLVFQDPYSSLNPILTLGSVLTEVIERWHPALPKEKSNRRAEQLLESVGLPPQLFFQRLPRELSGGQRQRVAIARALAADPVVLICDEAVSALDAALQTEIMLLLDRLRKEKGLSLLFISHDLALVSEYAERILIMEEGRIVEVTTPERLRHSPRTEIARRLLSAAQLSV